MSGNETQERKPPYRLRVAKIRQEALQVVEDIRNLYDDLPPVELIDLEREIIIWAEIAQLEITRATTQAKPDPEEPSRKPGITVHWWGDPQEGIPASVTKLCGTPNQ